MNLILEAKGYPMEKESPTPRNKSPHLKITLKLYRKSGSTSIYHSTKTKRIFAILKHEDFSKCRLKVSYGKHQDVLGDLVDFCNSGDYYNREDLLFALRAFSERSLVDYFWS